MKWFEKIFKSRESMLFDEQSTSDVIKKIKNEYQDVSEHLKESAEDLLRSLEEQSTKLTEKAKLLKEAGFINSEIVLELERINKEKREKKEELEYINKAKATFPNNKFITEDNLKKILNKYCMSIYALSSFKEYVPVEALLDIKNFKDTYKIKIYKKKRIDQPYDHYTARNSWEIITKIEYDQISEIQKVEYPSYTDSDGRMKSHDLYRSEKELYETRVRAARKYYLEESDVQLSICCYGDETTQKVDKAKKNSQPIVIMETNEFSKYGKKGYIIITSWGDDLPYDPLIYNEPKEE